MFRWFPDTEGKAIMPKGSEELTNSRKEEIVNACAQLYETVPFKEITLQEQIRDEKDEISREIDRLFLEQLLSELPKEERRLRLQNLRAVLFPPRLLRG